MMIFLQCLNEFTPDPPAFGPSMRTVIASAMVLTSCATATENGSCTATIAAPTNAADSL
ncbi:MAG: hypothetical protein GDA56_08310 [Hormoscilla sp. GM7CHS1pb]|nr:hypothetical protein [Hormoscilla sp. GM7CHS1pb]